MRTYYNLVVKDDLLPFDLIPSIRKEITEEV